MSSSDDGDKPTYDVGKGKPPKSSQFKPGQSGNPNGRPKGTLNTAAIVRKYLAEKVPVQANGKQKRITREEVIVRNLGTKAMAADVKAVRILCEMAEKDASLQKQHQHHNVTIELVRPPERPTDPRIAPPRVMRIISPLPMKGSD